MKDIRSITQFLNNSTLFFENDLKEIKSYLDNPDIGLKDTDGYVKYVYSSSLNVYRRIPVRDSATREIKYITGFPAKEIIKSRFMRIRIPPCPISLIPKLTRLPTRLSR
ncbi:MAG: hypothetical protein L6V82_05805 [Clostridiales bacterium]|nr:MAG: hypothetical protein L6V82_05805 [Clostridiales bacterium]